MILMDFGPVLNYYLNQKYVCMQGKLLQPVTGQMSNHICSVSAPGLTKLAGRNNLPLIEMIECLAN